MDAMKLCQLLDDEDYEAIQEAGIEDMEDACGELVMHYQKLHSQHKDLRRELEELVEMLDHVDPGVYDLETAKAVLAKAT